jgi:hypothetical protein
VAKFFRGTDQKGLPRVGNTVVSKVSVGEEEIVWKAFINTLCLHCEKSWGKSLPMCQSSKLNYLEVLILYKKIPDTFED